MPARRQSNTTSGLRWCRSSMSLPSPALDHTSLSGSLFLDTLSQRNKGAAPLALSTPQYERMAGISMHQPEAAQVAGGGAPSLRKMRSVRCERCAYAAGSVSTVLLAAIWTQVRFSM